MVCVVRGGTACRESFLEVSFPADSTSVLQPYAAGALHSPIPTFLSWGSMSEDPWKKVVG